MTNEEAWYRCNHCDRREIGYRIEWQLGVKRGIDRVAGKTHKERMTVRRGFGDCIGGQIAAGTSSIVDDDGLSQRTRHRFRKRASNRIGSATRRGANQQLNWPRRIAF